MDQLRMENIAKIASEIENFAACYKGNEVWGSIDGPVGVHKLIEFLIEHPEFQNIANNIDKLSKENTQ